MGKLLFVVFALSVGCAAEEPDSAATQAELSPAPAASHYKRPSEEPLVALAQKVPEFGGYYCENGDLVVLLTPTNAVPHRAIEEMIDPNIVSGCFDHDSPQHVPGIVFSTSKHSFNSLRHWRDAVVDNLLATPGVVSVGISYKHNRLTISARPEVVGKVAGLPALKDVPVTAYDVKAGEFPHRTGSPCSYQTPGHLYDCFQPVPGGVQFVHVAGGEVGCTLGVAVSRFMGASWADGWITASHCLPPKWRMDSVQAFQPNNYPLAFIGTEAVDPVGFTCAGSFECRYSDSAFIQASPANEYQVPAVGRIARTTSNNGSNLIDQNYSFFSIRDYRYLTEGMEVHKVGNSSGWTYGSVTDVCQDMSLTDPPNSMELCQFYADYYATYGDSGSPVFDLRDTVNFDSMAVNIVGINWGMLGGTNLSIYSPWEGVVSDLGLIASNDPNMAAGATVVASSSQESGGWGVAKVVDSNRRSVPNSAPPWSMGYSSTVGVANHEEWVEIDFPYPKTFSKVVLYPRDDAGNVGEFFPIDFKIQVWNGSAWLDRRTWNQPGKPDDSPLTFTWGYSDTTDRVRIDATNLRNERIGYPCRFGTCYFYEYMMQFAEIEVYP